MYVKVFTSLFDGSMRGQPDLILVFINLLCHCDEDGVVERHWRAVADETGLTTDRVKEALLGLEGPDPESRTRTEEGRRIKRIEPDRDWGWEIINYKHYRKLQSKEERRQYMQEYMQKRRSGEDVNTCKQSVNKKKKPLAKLTQAEAKAKAKAEEDQLLPVDTPDPTHPAQDSSLSSKPSLEESGSGFPPDSQDCETHEDRSGGPISQSAGNDADQGGDRKPQPKPRTSGKGRETWLTAYNDIHIEIFGGDMKSMGQAGKDFKKVEALHGREQSIAGWRVHCRTEGKYASPSYYQSRPLEWMPPPPVVCEDPNVVFARQRLSCKVEDLVRPDTEKEKEEKRREHEAYMKRCL